MSDDLILARYQIAQDYLSNQTDTEWRSMLSRIQRLEGRFAEVSWNAEDVQTLFDVSLEDADLFLGNVEDELRERMIERGWGVLETLALQEGLPEKRDDEEDDERTEA